MIRNPEEYWQEQRKKIDAWRQQESEAHAVIDVCKQWFSDVAKSHGPLSSRHDLEGLPCELSLAERLSLAQLEAFSAAFTWQVEDRVGTPASEVVLVAHALAVAGGRVYATLGVREADWIWQFIASIDTRVCDDFIASAAEVLRDESSFRAAFIDVLTEIVSEAIKSPDEVAEIPPRQASMAVMVEQYKRVTGFQTVWESDRYPILFKWGQTFEVLRRTDELEFLRLVEQLPHPALAGQCLRNRTIEETLRLFRIASAAFDAERVWQPHSMAAVLLLRAASTQLFMAADRRERARWEADWNRRTRNGSAVVGLPKEHVESDIRAFQESAEQILSALFGRSDGAELAWYWLDNIVDQIPRSPPQRAKGAGQQFVVCYACILMVAISKQLSPRHSATWIDDVKRLSRTSRVASLLSVAANSATEPKVDFGALAFEILKRNCFEILQPANLIRTPGAAVRMITGAGFANMSGAAAWFTRCWGQLRLQREQAWHRRPERDRSNPAETIVLWGLGAIETAIETVEIPRDEVKKLWISIENIVREAHLTEPRIGRDFWAEALARLFEWWPRIFLEPTKPEVRDRTLDDRERRELMNALFPYVRIGVDFMVIVVGLYQVGVRSIDIDAAILESGFRLDRMISRFRETTRRLHDAQLWNQAWVETLKAIEEGVRNGASAKVAE